MQKHEARERDPNAGLDPVASADAIRRTVWIEAPPATVFEYFVDPARLALWMGEADTLDPQPGGAIRILKGGDMTMRGEYVAIEPPHRVVFTFGWEGRADLPPGSSRVEVRLAAEAGGTRVDLVHDGLGEDRFEATGWSHSLERLRVAAAT